MSKKTIALLFLLIITPVLVYVVWPSDEARIKKLFKEGSHAIETKNLNNVMARVSFNYRDEYGLTYLYIKEYMKRIFQRMEDIHIEYENLQIHINDKTASAEMDVRVVATIGDETGYIFGDFPNPKHMVFTLQKERTKWLVTKTKGLPFEW